MEYQALFEPGKESGFVVTFPDFSWRVTQGDSEDEAMDMAIDALAIVIADCIEKERTYRLLANIAGGSIGRFVCQPCRQPKWNYTESFAPLASEKLS